MDKIENIDVHSGVVQTQAGVILEKLDTELGEHGLMAPLDLGAKGSCQIGGNVAANAGGIFFMLSDNFQGKTELLKVRISQKLCFLPSIAPKNNQKLSYFLP